MRRPTDLEQARSRWRWRGAGRPSFAVTPGPGQESVWDYPRPPRLAPDSREIVVRWRDVEVVRTTRAIRALVTPQPGGFHGGW